MLHLTRIAWILTVLLVPAVTVGADQKSTETLASLKKEQEAAWDELAEGRKPGTSEADKKKAVEHFYETVGELGRRAVAFAKKHPGTSESVEALVWAHDATTENDPELAGVIYNLLAKSYLDSDAILRLCGFAWLDAGKDPQVEQFLRTAIERSRNIKVRALCYYSLGKHQFRLARLTRDLNDPVRGEILSENIESLGPAFQQRLQGLDPNKLEHEAEACFERTIQDFGDLRPLGKEVPPMRELAEGMLFKMYHLSIGRTAPEIEGEDIDGHPMKLSDFRGKVVLVSFWATWCGPCMGLVPHEKTLVETMKERPFVLIGVNGDMDRETAKSVSAKEAITWRSFWTGGPRQGIPLQWGVSGWPTIYVIDGNGVIRDDGLVYFHEFRDETPNRMIESLVMETEKASKS